MGIRSRRHRSSGIWLLVRLFQPSFYLALPQQDLDLDQMKHRIRGAAPRGSLPTPLFLILEVASWKWRPANLVSAKAGWDVWLMQRFAGAVDHAVSRCQGGRSTRKKRPCGAVAIGTSRLIKAPEPFISLRTFQEGGQLSAHSTRWRRLLRLDQDRVIVP